MTDLFGHGLIECPELDQLREVFFELAWHQQGGSGLHVSLGELEDMRVEDLLWYVERVRQQREKESAAIKSSGGRPAVRAPRRIARARGSRRRR